MPKSALACHTCRRRKVKCDREFPQCLVCRQTSQPCNYPLRPMKPGPKIGSLQRQRRCRPTKTQRTDRKRPAESHSSSPTEPIEPNMNTYDGSFLHDDDGEEDVSENEEGTRMAATDGDQKTSQLNMHDLSFILHPCHEPSSPDQDQNQSPETKQGGQAGLCRQACSELGLSWTIMNQMIGVYIDNMVAINLFHVPSFHEKLLEIPSLSQISALFAAIAAYASRFMHAGTGADASVRQPEHFVDLAFKHIDEALAECGDEMPPLCVIQALIIATHCQLTRGVRGKAWRSLGLCVRLAYEINLHLLDFRRPEVTEDPAQWLADEEKRRAFWAIWEMDVFASTIRRTPTAIDWRQMEIMLPVDDADWFQRNPVASCFMEAEPSERWKALQECGNRSPKAWFLVINSLMKDAQVISNPRGSIVQPQPTDRFSTPESVEQARQKLETLANAVRCFSLALPAHLQYRDQYLSFDPVGSHRQQHCGIYNIFVMTQLARLMIHRYDAFRPPVPRAEPPGDGAEWMEFSIHNAEGTTLRHYFDAADSILKIVSQSCEEHIQHINPFLSSTIWLASAVQLVRKHFARTPASKSLIKSRFDVLYCTYKRCVQFWDTRTALQQNLESLEVQLEAKPTGSDLRECRPCQTKNTSNRIADEQSSLARQSDQAQNDTKAKWTTYHTSTKPQYNQAPTQLLPETSPTTLGQGRLQGMAGQDYNKVQPGAVENMATLDYVSSLPQGHPNAIPEPHMMAPNPSFFNLNALDDPPRDDGFEWRNFDFPGGIQDLLAGWSTY